MVLQIPQGLEPHASRFSHGLHLKLCNEIVSGFWKTVEIPTSQMDPFKDYISISIHPKHAQLEAMFHTLIRQWQSHYHQTRNVKQSKLLDCFTFQVWWWWSMFGRTQIVSVKHQSNDVFCVANNLIAPANPLFVQPIVQAQRKLEYLITVSLWLE